MSTLEKRDNSGVLGEIVPSMFHVEQTGDRFPRVPITECRQSPDLQRAAFRPARSDNEFALS